MKLYRRPNRKSFYTRQYSGGREKLVCLHTSDKREAERILVRMAYDRLPENIKKYHDKPGMTLREAWREYSESPKYITLADTSKKSISYSWNRFVNWTNKKNIDDVSIEVAESFLSFVRETASPQTAKQYRSYFSTIWKYVLRDPQNVWFCVRIDPVIEKKKYRSLSNEELNRLFAYCSGEELRAVQIGLYTGLRLSDAIAVHSDQINGDYIILVPAKTKRLKKEVRIPIHPALSWLQSVNGYATPILYEKFTTGDRTTVCQIFRTIFRNAEVSGSFHCLRDTFATLAEGSGLPRNLVQAAMGHSSERMTGHYSEATLSPQQIASIQTVSK